MKILIAADMEGVTGVVSWDQVDSTHPEYARFRRLMTGDVNAAIRGAFAGGAGEVVVADGHGSGRNILIEELDARARLNSGGSGPLSMVEGVQHGVQGTMFVGYHARSGSTDANLDHTWSDTRVANVWLNGTLVGESGLNGAVCGHFGVPIILIAGDQTVCAEATATFGKLEMAVVKRATGRYSAEVLPPAITQELIGGAAQRAVERLRAGDAPAPFVVSRPVTLTIEFNQSDMADRAALCPGAERIDGKRVELTVADMPTAYRGFRTLLALART
jgi:D-amino peptidase